jgi:hypothetical protein
LIDFLEPRLDDVALPLLHDEDQIGPFKQLDCERHGSLLGKACGIHLEIRRAGEDRFSSRTAQSVGVADEQDLQRCTFICRTLHSYLSKVHLHTAKTQERHMRMARGRSTVSRALIRSSRLLSADSSIVLNRVVVALAQQTDNVTWLVNNDGEEASDVTAQYVDVQRSQLRYRGVLTAEYNFA